MIDPHDEIFSIRDILDSQLLTSDRVRIGPTLYLRGKAEDYAVGQSDRWIAEHILRWIPGNG